MEHVKRRRTVLRRSFTKHANRLKELFGAENIDRTEVDACWTQLQEKQETLKADNEEIFEKLLEDGSSEAELEEEMDVCDEYSTTFNRLRVLYAKLSQPQVTQEASTASSVSGVNSHSSSHLATRKYRLPIIEFKKFSGDVRDWLPFWSQFAKIDEDDSLPPEDKFQYLIQATMPNSRARELLDSYPPTAGNYRKAIESLKSRFGRDEVLVEVYIRELLKLVITNVMSKENKLGISTLYDKIETQLRSLETLGVTTETCAAMLYPLVESCLPEELLRVWQRSAEIQTESTLKNRLTRLMTFLKSEVENEERISLAIEGFGLGDCLGDGKIKSGKQKVAVVNQPTALGLINTQSGVCTFCDGTHNIEKCFKVQKLTFEQKQKLLREKRACFRCAKTGHQSRKCRDHTKCIICGGQHIVVLCPDLTAMKRSTDDAKPVRNTSPNNLNEKTLSNHTDVQVVLQTLRVMMRSDFGTREVRAVIDSGSQRSYVLKATANEFRYTPKRTVNVVHALFGGVNTSEQNHVCYDVRLVSLDSKYACTFEVLDQAVICHSIAPVQYGVWMDELKRAKIKLTDTKAAGPIELLLGADIIGKLYTGRKRQLNCGLVAFETLLGWTLMGKIPHVKLDHNMTMTATTLLSSDMSLVKLWQLDVLGIEDPIAQESKAERGRAIKDFFEQNISVNEEGRYETRLLWIEGHPPLPSNYNISKKRLETTVNKLRNNGYFREYCQVFTDWVEEGIIEEVPASELGNPAHYLPHRPVIKENSTTKVRPVFDASAREKEKPSLNHCLEKGVNLIETIPDILLKFRMGKLGVVSDIRKAFLQISLNKRDRDCLRFLWVREDNSEMVYRHRRVVFGVNCSPFLLGATIEYHLNKCLTECESNDYSQENIVRLRDSFYVDNCVTSLPDEESLTTFIREATQVMDMAKFDLRGWESTGDMNEGSKTTSVLGLTWDRSEDSLAICHKIKLEKIQIVTKRVILSIAQSIFDPIGFTAPATVIPKLLLQQMWEDKIGWDQEIDESNKALFLKWYREVSLLLEIRIPRWIMGEHQDTKNLTVHVFCDASKQAYAAAVFLRVEENENVNVFLLQAKVRIAPLKRLSIPRLELMAATVGARLYHGMKKNFSSDIKAYFWSDSSTVLSWIRRSDEWATFVWNRIHEIRTLTSVENWRHVPGTLNPADLPSRGCSPKNLLESRWWEGPMWLRSQPFCWPEGDFEVDDEVEVEINKERKKKFICTMMNTEDVVWYGRYFSKYEKIVRMVSWIYRFAHNCKNPKNKKTGELSTEEVIKGERGIISLIQKESFIDENDKKISALGPFRDEHGLMRIKSKISNREDTPEFRFPLLLPEKHVVVQRLIYDLHISSCHAGVQSLLCILREKYWVLGGRRAVRTVINRCVSCRRFNARNLDVQPPPLPIDRVRDAAIFQIVGIDLAGPIFLRNKKKVWICLFTCAVYRAVHLDIVTSLSTEHFISALRRFIARRGRPSIIYTDNGTNFVGTENAFGCLDWKSIAKYSTTQRIVWKFNPPSAPWWGGWCERLIGLVKQLLRRTLGRACLNTEELYTLLCDCEAVINARPLTYISNEQSDLVPLTPAMFLHELKETEVPDCDLVDSTKLKRRAAYLQTLRENLRRRFRAEYLGQLRQVFGRKKTRNVNIGEIVLIGDDVTKRVNWPMGRVVELIPGRDDKVRLVRIQTSHGQLLRPVQRVYPLECVEKLVVADPGAELRIEAPEVELHGPDVSTDTAVGVPEDGEPGPAASDP